MHYEHRGPDTWLLTWELGRDPATGQRLRKRRTIHGDEADAAIAWAEEAKKQRNGTDYEPSKLTVEEWLQTWLEGKAQGLRPLRPSTLQSYQDLLRLHVIPAVGAMPLQRLRPQHVQAAVKRWAETPRHAPKQKKDTPPKMLSPRTVAYCWNLLASALDQAVKWQLVERNVARLIDPPAQPHPERSWWGKEAIAKFLAVAGDHREGIAFGLALFGGLRRGEICGLRWKDVDWKSKILTVRHTRVLVHGRAEASTPKTTVGFRQIPLPDGLIEWLHLHHARQNREKLQGPEPRVPHTKRKPAPSRPQPKYDDHGYVLQTTKGTPTNPRNLYRTYRRLLQQAGVPPITLHDLRHTFASHLLAQGANIRVISDLLGHSKVSFTLQTYTHSSVDHQRAAVDQWGSSILGPQNGHKNEQ